MFTNSLSYFGVSTGNHINLSKKKEICTTHTQTHTHTHTKPNKQTKTQNKKNKTKPLNELGIEENTLKIIKAMYEKFTVIIILSGERLERFFSKIKARIPAFATSIQKSVAFLFTKKEQSEKEIKKAMSLEFLLWHSVLKIWCCL